jgi:hypothetical protein
LRAGEEFEEGLLAGFDGAVVVALVTDQYSGRYWCVWEVVTGKNRRCPFLVVDALSLGEPRSLRYVGNARTLRWPLLPEEHERAGWAPGDKVGAEADDKRWALRGVVQGALIELLRWRHDRARIDAARAAEAVPSDAIVLGGPPELATFPPLEEGRKWLIVHPDPPLPKPERELLKSIRPDVDVASLTEALSGQVSLAGLRVAVSISDPPDLAARGLTTSHLKRLWLRMTLQLLLAGAELGYGGDLRKQGYTDHLGDLLMSLASVQRGPPEDTVHSYLGWPTWVSIDPAEWMRYPRSVKWHRLLAPSGLTITPNTRLAPNWSNPEVQLGWTVSMRAMRERMAREHDARILVGGQHRAVSPVPGLVDELTTFLDLEKPVYLLGGFGGMTAVLVRALQGERPEELTTVFQDESGKRKTVRESINEALAERSFVDGGEKSLAGSVDDGHPIMATPTDFDALVARLNDGGVGALRNGLDEEQNQRLFVTRDPVEAIALVLRGLASVSPGEDG